ncbi:CoA-transferase subunit beta [Saccharopolyspora dendranthemae]|uniref:Acyl CoA:acetate/3-ketoacid CoA transferase beta subunit n=1 Tax=Saccharopolyspora dendranthemae TaxID=1181886 RepID=A0A561U317_9PSEU|nr:CoA-transferase [Saccharopolyspora dendranthemae]TWF93753.1 acyl CoA:acetate/3-ketoacid CoA transferase beta subunit [Saccharopolyspora dendranthemae]
MTITRAEICAVACADSFADAGAAIASPFGTIPSIGARLARLTTAPDLLMSDGEAMLLSETPALGEESTGTVEGWLPYNKVLDLLTGGKRRVMMGASQVDRFGNQNISRIGDWAQPKVQLIGVRGAPGNSVNHTTNYWIPNHSTKIFVESVDLVAGVGHDRAKQVGAKYHDVQVVVTDLAVLDFQGPDGSMRLRSVHPGVSVDEVREKTGFELAAGDVAETRSPTDEELSLIRDRIDPKGLRDKEVPS